MKYVYAGEPFDEVYHNVRPHRRRDLEGLKKASKVEMLRLVPLAGGTGAHEFDHQCACVQNMEVGTELMESLGDALMAHAVCCCEHLMEACRSGQQVDPNNDEQQVVVYPPPSTSSSCYGLVPMHA
jgi:hypothetical protein